VGLTCQQCPENAHASDPPRWPHDAMHGRLG
jgi:hypothetical protein